MPYPPERRGQEGDQSRPKGGHKLREKTFSWSTWWKRSRASTPFMCTILCCSGDRHASGSHVKQKGRGQKTEVPSVCHQEIKKNKFCVPKMCCIYLKRTWNNLSILRKMLMRGQNCGTLEWHYETSFQSDMRKLFSEKCSHIVWFSHYWAWLMVSLCTPCVLFFSIKDI